MQIEQMNSDQVKNLLHRENRAVLPLGCTEQHAFLSLSTDSILASKLSIDVCEPLRVPVFPVLTYGLTPSFIEFPGTISLQSETYLRVVKDIVAGILRQGFSRLLIVNGHGGNTPAKSVIPEVLKSFPEARVIWHDWWIGPKTWKHVQSIDADASHASWMESFPWTRPEGVVQPTTKKPMIDPNRYHQLSPTAAKAYLGDGSFGGLYQRSDDEMQSVWDTAVNETREILESGWAD